MNTLPRIHIEFASGCAKAAILRRGPSNWVRLLLWDTADDIIHEGAWFHGRIYENACSISPDGKLFAYVAAKQTGHSKNCGAWTAVSKPPWLTAIAFWPRSGTQGCSTSFVSNDTLIVSHPHWDDMPSLESIPESFAVLSKLTGSDAPPQSLPEPSKSSAWFINGKGVDQLGQTFEYFDGKWIRDGNVISDLAAMQPDPQASPEWARRW